MKTALLAGSTGLIGKQLLTLLLQDERYDKVKALSRRPINLLNSKLENIVLDFDSLPELANRLKADDVFCCLGTTMKQAGSKEAFKKVDQEYPVELAKLTKEQDAKQYFLVSALGADRNSSIYYNRVKGIVEEDLKAVNFDSLHVFRPSLLIGPREEKRPGEEAGKRLYRILGFLIPKKYKAIDSLKVAKAMLHYAQAEQPGVHVHESGSMQEFN